MALVGIVALFWESLPVIIIAVTDGLTIVLLGAAGIVRSHHPILFCDALC